MSDIREQVRDRYAEAARTFGRENITSSTQTGCCGETTATAASGTSVACCGTVASPEASTSGCCGPTTSSFGPELYEIEDRGSLPDSALLASLGCGNPTAVADLRPGETVLDLGSGGGIDVLLSAQRVGPSGKAYGLDMTDEMLTVAIANKVKADATNAEFLKGYIEAIPLPAGVVDVVISNCVINLAADKSAVFSEMFRVLKPGGRVGVSDVVASDDLSSTDRAERGSYVGCIAGALSFYEYKAGLVSAGFEDVSITPTHTVADGMHSAIIKAAKPSSGAAPEARLAVRLAKPSSGAAREAV
jgi:SAM-dependent methyltransferase